MLQIVEPDNTQPETRSGCLVLNYFFVFLPSYLQFKVRKRQRFRFIRKCIKLFSLANSFVNFSRHRNTRKDFLNLGREEFGKCFVRERMRITCADLVLRLKECARPPPPKKKVYSRCFWTFFWCFSRYSRNACVSVCAPISIRSCVILRTDRQTNV